MYWIHLPDSRAAELSSSHLDFRNKPVSAGSVKDDADALLVLTSINADVVDPTAIPFTIGQVERIRQKSDE